MLGRRNALEIERTIVKSKAEPKRLIRFQLQCECIECKWVWRERAFRKILQHFLLIHGGGYRFYFLCADRTAAFAPAAIERRIICIWRRPMLVQYVAIARRGNSFVPQFMLLRRGIAATLFFAKSFSSHFGNVYRGHVIVRGQCRGNTVDQMNECAQVDFVSLLDLHSTTRPLIFPFSLTFRLGEPAQKPKRDSPLHIQCASARVWFDAVFCFFSLATLWIASTEWAQYRQEWSGQRLDDSDCERAARTQSVAARNKRLNYKCRNKRRKQTTMTATTTRPNSHKSKSHITCVRLSNRPHNNIIHSIQFNDMYFVRFP